jgi:D-alanyl-D-alanine carboxypeptidase
MRRSMQSSFVALLLAAFLGAMPVPAAPPAAVSAPHGVDDATLVRGLDALLQPIFGADQPGVAVLVARNGKPVYRRGFGLADMDHKTAITPEMVFRIGSVTKQFTAAVILRLAEQGKLSLQDDITRYLPGYPTQGKTITIENLLTHTSGIADYTALPAWQSHMKRDFTVQQVIDLFKDQPMNFAPGTQWAYSNSGYFLLGAIIEKVTGRTYSEVLQTEILAPLGMKHSGYGKSVPSFPGEVWGYERQGDKVMAADSLSMTSPYAAGAIVSSVDDLLRWDNGLNSGRVLKPESMQRMWTSYTLANGKPTGYGYGWLISTYEGHRIQEHNGGINGFFSHVTRLPDDHLYVALLFNTGTPIVDGDFLALKVAAVALGNPLPEPGAFTMTPEQLDRFVAVYQVDSTATRTIVRDGAKLYSQRSGRPRLEIFPTSDSTFAFAERAGRVVFGHDASGRVDRMTVTQSGVAQTALRTAKPIAAERQAIHLDAAQLQACAGVYELAPTFSITVTLEGSSLMAQATGQPKFEIFPASATLFFYKVVDAQIEFQAGTDGRMSGMILHQGGRNVPGKRVP